MRASPGRPRARRRAAARTRLFDGARRFTARGDGSVTRLDGLRIAVLNWRDPWQPVAGGAEEYAWQISRQLLARGAHVTFATSRTAGQRRAQRRGGIAIRRMGGKYSRYPLVLAWLALHRGAFDAVIDCMNGIPFFSPLVLPRRTPVVCVVHHVHDRQFFVHFPPWLAGIGAFLEGPVSRLVYRNQTVATVSPSTVAAMRRRLHWTGPIHVIPNGCPQARTDPARTDPVTVDPVDVHPVLSQRPRPDAEPAEPVLVCVGRLVVHKRVRQVVDLAAELRTRWPRLVLHIVGRGLEFEPLREYVARLGAGEYVRMHGFMPQEDKDALVSSAHLHVSASRFEGWGLSVIEAAALGVPTLAYDVDGLRDAIRDGETGWLVGGGELLVDVADRALKELSDPRRRAELAAACRRWSALFTWAGSGERMAALLADELTLPAAVRCGRVGGPVHVVCYDSDGGPSSILVAAGDLADARAVIAARGDTVVDVRPATAAELLFGRAAPR